MVETGLNKAKHGGGLDMQRSASGHLYSASDLVNYAACPHITHLDLINLDTPLQRAADAEETVLIQNKGFAHEARYLETLRATHGEVVDLKTNGSDQQAFEATCAALRSGKPVLFQATFLAHPWVGHADFLVRVDTPSELGDFSYEVMDTKLSKTSRAKFLVQLCLYSEMLAQVQGVMPKHMHVVLGDGRQETFLVADYLRYYRQLKQRFLSWAGVTQQSYPEKTDRCDMCGWREICRTQWEKDDHLNRVAGITKQQIPKLNKAGVSTMQGLADLSPSSQVPGIQAETRQKLIQQARLQIQTLKTGQPVFEYLPRMAAKGFERLPHACQGDLYFDMEGNPLEDGGLEYLFGLYYFDQGQAVFKPFWAHSRAEEKKAFEAFIDFVTSHLQKWPDAHVYHYAPYEPTALKRLMSLHGTRELEVDNLLRFHKLVDLYAVVRESIRVGEPSYSIKYIEHFYSAARTGDVKNAGASIVFYEQWKTTQDPALLQAIEDYNKDDVVSTFELHQWLMKIANAQEVTDPGSAPAPEEKPSYQRSEKALAAEAEMESLRIKLTDKLPEDPLKWTEDDRVHELMSQLLSFHKRAGKPHWWAKFARAAALEEDLINDVDVIAGMSALKPPVDLADSWACEYTYPEQEFKLKSGDGANLVYGGFEVLGLEIDEDQRLVKFRCRGPEPAAHGLVIGPSDPIPVHGIVGAYKRFVNSYLEGRKTFQAGLDLLHRSRPRIQGHTDGQPLTQVTDLLASTLEAVKSLDNSCLFIQGPPGAGKTYTGSHVLVELMKAGKKVAIASNSHKAINNLLHGVEKVALDQDLMFEGYKKSTSSDSLLNGKIIGDVSDNKSIFNGVDKCQLVAGTAWLFASEKLEQKFDYLFVDEAGQVSLANLLAMSTCAKNVVLLGDQMQLGQPIQGVHPGDSGKSTLDYLLNGAATIASDKGIFLKDTWRMHPDVCRFISEAVYEGRLESEPSTKHQQLVLKADSHPAIKTSGIRFLEVNHDGCSQRSEVEARLIKELFENLLAQSYTDRHGQTHPMGIDNILVVAPYNQQVNLLKRLLPEGARVGTVDKFQGQEAEVVLVSMTTSSGDYLPRNIEFLYSKNRLNVAISRARTLAVVIANPALLQVDCNTPEQMALVNTLCWVSDYAQESD